MHLRVLMRLHLQAQISKTDLPAQSPVVLICVSSFFCPQWPRLLPTGGEALGKLAFPPCPAAVAKSVSLVLEACSS